jgi:hypothetical protein
MTRDDIIRMAKEAGFNQILATNAGEDVWIDDGFYVEELKNFAVLVAAAEREACAEVCFDMAQQHNDIRSAALEMASEYIRARAKT